jgi:hypothetical protein
MDTSRCNDTLSGVLSLSNCDQTANISEFFGDESPTIQNDLNHRSLAHAAIYARLNTKTVDHALRSPRRRERDEGGGVQGRAAVGVEAGR